MSDVISLGDVLVSEECKLEWNIKENKKRIGCKSWERMEYYIGSKNVGEYLNCMNEVKGVSKDEIKKLKDDLKYDYKKGFLSVVDRFDFKSKKVIKI